MRTKKKLLLLIILLLAAGLLTGCGGRDSSVVVAGSTSVQPYAEVLAEAFSERYPDHIVDVQGGGSSAGITAAESGTADIGMSSRALNAKEQDLWVVEIARDGLAVIVHPDSPLLGLSIEQVRAIYAADITNWSGVGGQDAEIHVISREEGSGTRDAFVSQVMGASSITPRAIVQDSNGAVRQLVAGDPDAIGYISLGLVDDTVKALALDGVAATWENVVNGSYTLYRPFLFVSREAPAGKVQDFIDFVLSPEGQEILTAEGLIPSEEGVAP